MASGGSGKDTEPDDSVNKLTCAICLEKYRRPKLLPCFHTFCQSCLRGVAGSSPSFHCPSCRTPVLLPPGGVGALQTNFYIEEDLDASAPSRQRRLCDVCAEDREATHSCLQCQQMFCLPCSKYHDALRLMRGHTIVPLTQEEEEGCGKGSVPSGKLEDKQKMGVCPKHPDQRLLLHCNKCQADICIQCKLTQHDGHPTDDLADTRAKVKTKLQDLLGSVTQQRHQIRHLITAFNDRHARLLQQQQETEQDFQGRADTLHQWVNQSLDDAVTMVQATVKELGASLQDHLAQLQNKDETLRAQQDHMTRVLKDGKDSDIADLEAQLTASSNSSESLDLKLVGKELLKNVPKFHVKHSSSAVNQLQLREFVGVLQPIHQTSSPEGTVTSLQSNCSAASAGSTDKDSPSAKSSVNASKKKSPREFIYSRNPQSKVIAMCPISHNRLWVMFSPANDAAVLMKLFDADGQVLITVENPQKGSSLISIDDDTILSWVYYDSRKYVQLIESNGKLSGHSLGIMIGHLIPCATNNKLYLRVGRESTLYRVRFSIRDFKLAYSKAEVLTHRAPQDNTPGHVSSGGQYCAFIVDVTVKVYTKAGMQESSLFSSYTPNNPPSDVRFCQIGGQEQLLVMVQGEMKVHIVDHTDGACFVRYLDTGPLNLDNLNCLAANFQEHVWIGCNGGKVVMVDLSSP